MQTRVADSLGLVRAQEVTFLKMRNSYILLLQFLPQRSVESTLNSDLEKKWNDEKRGVKTLSTQSPCSMSCPRGDVAQARKDSGDLVHPSD